jgi:threonyl-tRNA synthetase
MIRQKVREAQLAQYNYILVVGEAEKVAQTVNVRTRDNVVHGMFKLADVAALMVTERDSRSKESTLSGKGQKPSEGAADGAAEV